MTPRLVAGCDVVDVARLSAAIDRRDGLLERVFTTHELEDVRRGGVTPGSPLERDRLAARFAAKEAARKALGDLRLPFHATEVRRRDDGTPELWLRGAPSALVLSMSHDAGVAVAIVVGFADPQRWAPGDSSETATTTPGGSA